MLPKSFPSTIAISALLLQYLTPLTSVHALELHSPGVKITDQEYKATWAYFTGQEGCTEDQKHQISQAFHDAGGVLNQDKVRQNIDWTSTAAIEFLASPFNMGARNSIQDLYANAALYSPDNNWPTGFVYNVRCDDHLSKCGGSKKDRLQVYSNNEGGSNDNGAYTSFCPPFFETKNLENALELINDPDPENKYDLRKYDNQAEIVLHEMFHIDKISQHPPNKHVADLWLEIDEQWLSCYGPETSRTLSHVQKDPAQWIMQNADNLMYFPMTVFYQIKLKGEYPSRPFAGTVTDDDPKYQKPPGTSVGDSSVFNITNNMLQVSNQAAFAARAQNTRPTYDAALGETPVTITATSVKFAAITDYPASYQSSLSSWKSTWAAYLATATASPAPPSTTLKTTVSQPSPTPADAANDKCSVQYRVVLDKFKILGKGFDPVKFGPSDGSGLYKQIRGCGLVTKCDFHKLVVTDKNPYEWSASGTLPIGTKPCLGDALVSAGGSPKDGCTGTS